MKKVLTVLLSAVLLLSLCSCEGPTIKELFSPVPESEESSDASSAGETTMAEDASEVSSVFRLALENSCENLNYFTTENDTVKEIMTNCVDSLLSPDIYGEEMPAIAESWSCDDTQTVWSFRIRSGISWVDNNGNATPYAVSAQDFVDGVRYVSDPQNNAASVDFIRSLISGMDGYMTSLEALGTGEEYALRREELVESFDETVGITAVDEYTVQFTLTSPTPYFPSIVQSSMLLLPVERAYMEEAGELYGTDSEHMLYCGPYYISHFERSSLIVLTANPLYWDAASVQVSSIEYHAVETGSSQYEMFVSGVLDYAEITVEDYITMQGTEWENCLLPMDSSVSTDCLFFHFGGANSEFAVFAENENFRKAVLAAVDRQSIAYLRNPVSPGDTIRGTLNAEDVLYDVSGNEYTDYALLKVEKATSNYDTAAARKYMLSAVLSLTAADGSIIGSSAGTVDYQPVGEFTFDGKLPLDVVYACSNDNEDIILAHFLESTLEEAIGTDYIDIHIVCMDDWDGAKVPQNGKADLYIAPVVTEYADPSGVLQAFTTDGQNNYTGISLASYDERISSGLLADSMDDRWLCFAEAESQLCSGAYVIPLVSSENAYFLSCVIPFARPKADFGARRFKGMEMSEGAVSLEEYQQRKKEYQAGAK